MEVVVVALILRVLIFVSVQASLCVTTTTNPNDSSEPLYLLALVPFPVQTNASGWDGGLTALAGARVARDEINKRSGFLPGYRIELIERNADACSLPMANTALINIVEYAFSPVHIPVMAIIGLMCSSHTRAISPIAGRSGVDLLQLTAANSPVFTSKQSQFHHLWNFLGSSDVYADTMLSLMDEFKWNKVGVVYNAGSQFFSGITNDLLSKTAHSQDKQIVFSDAVTPKNKDIVLNQIISTIEKNGITIMFICLDTDEIAKLLCQAFDNNIKYPRHVWIMVNAFLEHILNSKACKREIMLKALKGHIVLQSQINPRNTSTVIVSGETFSSYKVKYDNEVLNVGQEYGQNNFKGDYRYSSLMYDQVWAFALAFNQSLPVLKYENVSIENFNTIGQLYITQVIEDHLKAIDFQGASGHIKFNEKKMVSALTIEVLQVIVNGTTKVVGIYDMKNVPSLQVVIDTDDIVSAGQNTNITILIPLGLSISFYIWTVCIIMFTTVQLALFYRYRRIKQIKATSPCLSYFMFVGIFLVCFSIILRISYSGFVMSEKLFIACVSLYQLLVSNGTSFFFIALFIKLLRLHRIFTAWMKNLGKSWNTWPLVLIITFLSIGTTIVLVISFHIIPPHMLVETVYNSKDQVTEVRISNKPSASYTYLGIILFNLATFLVLVLLIAYKNRNIQLKLFNDGKVHLYLVTAICTLPMMLSIYFILLLKQKQTEADCVLVMALLTQCLTSQCILFSPTIGHIILEKYFPSLLKNHQ